MPESALPLVFSRAQALRLGWTDHAVTWRLRRGDWHVLRRGRFCTAEVFAAATAPQRHLLVALALSLACHPEEVLSHVSAALAYGWWAPLDVAPLPWTTHDPKAERPTRRTSDRVRQIAPLPANHVRQELGLQTTSPARTVADCLRHMAAEESVPIADCALAHGLCLEQVAAVLDWQCDWPYARRAFDALELVDGRRESWLESRSVVAFKRMGIALPTPQVDIHDERGRFIARVDFLWPKIGLIGEADGWSKYGALVAQHGHASPFDALKAEKAREDRLRDLGYEIMRWSTSDVLNPQRELGARWVRAAARARPDRVRGTTRARVHPASSASIEAAGWQALLGLSSSKQLLLPPPYSLADGADARKRRGLPSVGE